jgi:hypothetical protein
MRDVATQLSDGLLGPRMIRPATSTTSCIFLIRKIQE